MDLFHTVKSKTKLVRELLDILNIKDKHLSAVKILANNFSVYELKDIIIAEAKESVGDLMDEMVSIFENAFDKEDLRSIVEFLNSRVGKTYLSVGTDLEDRLADVGMAWSKTIFMKAEKKLQEDALQILVDKGINPMDYIPPLNIDLYNWG
jgi:hypothetical protein